MNGPFGPLKGPALGWVPPPVSSIAESTPAIDHEKALRDERQLTEQAFSGLARLEAAREHWLERVKGAGLGATEGGLAGHLALLAHRRVERGLEIFGSVAEWARRCGLKDGDAITHAIPRFQTQGLINVLVQGRGGRKWHLILLFSAQHWQEVEVMAKAVIDREKANTGLTGVRGLV